MTFSETVLKFSLLAVKCEILGENYMSRECNEFSNELLSEDIDNIEINLIDDKTAVDADPIYTASSISAYRIYDNGTEIISVKLSDKLWKILSTS